ncbi:hypothetical protein C8R43DRAFT_1169126 [Mycena crocata]|nr:hypothetical protein C8R43DRAFT_1169126 [Mycena crocata]
MHLGDTPEPPLLQLLVRHSSRWRNVFFCINPDSYHFLTDARNELLLLEVLDIADPGGSPIEFDIFQSAPRLTAVTFDGRISRVPQFPWARLRCHRMPNFALPSTQIASAPATDTDKPSIVSDISALSLPLTSGGFPERAKEALGSIFTALTLPRLLALELHRKFFEPAPLWNHTHFLTFAARSSFHAHLIELEIHIIITDDELVQCLAVLPLLKTLTISDCGGDTDHVVVTDQLLQRLTYTAEVQKCLIPNLHYFNFTTLFRFTPDTYLNFLASRLVPGRTHDKAPSRFRGEIWEFIYPPSCEPFQARFWWLSSRERKLPPDDFDNVFVGIAEMIGQKILRTRAVETFRLEIVTCLKNPAGKMRFYNHVAGMKAASNSSSNSSLNDETGQRIVQFSSVHMGDAGTKKAGLPQPPHRVEDVVECTMTRVDGATVEKSSGRFWK